MLLWISIVTATHSTTQKQLHATYWASADNELVQTWFPPELHTSKAILWPEDMGGLACVCKNDKPYCLLHG